MPVWVMALLFMQDLALLLPGQFSLMERYVENYFSPFHFIEVIQDYA